MISIHLNRFTQALVLAVVVAAFAVPAVALGNSSSGTAVPDVFERYAAAHPYNSDTAVPDVLERYAAAHPYNGVLDTRHVLLERYGATHGPAALVDGRSPDTLDAAGTQSASSFYTPAALKAMGERYQAAATFYRTQNTALDGRSPDTRDAAGLAQLQIVDGRSPDTVDASEIAQLRVPDGRSPDTIDAAQVVRPIELVNSRGFDWSDAGIGAGMGAGLILLMGTSMLLLLRVRRHHVQAT